LAVRSPFAEPDLSDELRADPVHALPLDARRVRERGCGALELRQHAREPVELPPVEAGPDLPRVAERSVLLVAHEQRADPGPAALRVGPPDHHELLLQDALELEPLA